jgi:hypothetical protein
MSSRHKNKLKNILETVAFTGIAMEPKEFFLMAYGEGQKRFTITVRDYIKSQWEAVKENIGDEIDMDYSERSVIIGETSRGMIIITLDNIFWDE